MHRSLKYILLFFLTTAFCLPRPVFAQKINKIVAIVNGDVITQEELDLFMKMAQMDKEEGLPQENPEELKKELLNRLIEDRLILQEAKTLQLKIDESLVEDRIRDVKQRAGGESAFNEALRNQGFSLTELREKIVNQLLIYNVIQKEVKAKVNVSPKEVADYYQDHESEFLTPEAVVVNSIFVPDKENLEEVERQLGEGKDFNEVAKTYSKKSNLGVVPRGQLKKELEDAVFSLGVGQCSRPVQVEDGTYLFLAKEKRPASKKTIDEVKDQITANLEKTKLEKTLKGWIEGLKEKAYISIREP